MAYKTKIVGCDHSKFFNLKWWRLYVSKENGYSKYEKLGYSGITITGFSDYENGLIRHWCKQQGEFHIQKIHTFEDGISSNKIMLIPNSDGMVSFTHLEREFGVFGADTNIRNLEKYLSKIVPRNLETFVHGISMSEIKKLCNDLNHRILEEKLSYRNKKIIAISTDNSNVYFDLYLRSAQGIEHL